MKFNIIALLMAISVQLFSNLAISEDNLGLIKTGLKGAELPLLKKFPTYDCYIYDNFVIFNIPSTEEASADSYIKKRSSAKKQSEDCSFDQLKANQYIFASGWYLGLKGDYVFSDEGCCPGTRTLSIVRISSGKQIYDTSYNSSYPVMIDERLNLRFYKEIEVKPTKQNCPQANERVKELELENQNVAVEDVLYSL